MLRVQVLMHACAHMSASDMFIDGVIMFLLQMCFDLFTSETLYFIGVLIDLCILTFSNFQHHQQCVKDTSLPITIDAAESNGLVVFGKSTCFRQEVCARIGPKTNMYENSEATCEAFNH